jgi:hypothetical protein
MPYMGYVFNSDCGFQARGGGFFEVASKKTQRSSPIFQLLALLQESWRNLFPQPVRSNPGRRNAIGKLVVVLFVFLASYLSLNASLPSEPLHYQLASDPHLNGKGKDGECMDYALALSSRLAEHGIHGRLIFYRWHIRGTETQGSHVFVFYRLPDNSEWIVDNEIPHPRKAPAGASLMDLVFLLSDTKAAPVDVELQNGLNHLSFF